MIALEKRKSVAKELKRCKEMLPAEANHTLTVRCCGENTPRYEAARLKCRYLAPGYKQLMAFLTVDPSLIKRGVNASSEKDGVALITKKHPEVCRWLSSLLDFFLALHTDHAEDTFAKCLRAHRKVLTTLFPPISLTQSAQLWRQLRKTMKEVKKEKNMLKKSHGGEGGSPALSSFLKFEVVESILSGFGFLILGVMLVGAPGGAALGLPLVIYGIYFICKAKYALDAGNEAS